MRRLALLIVTAALAVPALALAASSSSSAKKDAEHQCRTERSTSTGMGPAAFKLAYGTNKNRSNAFGKCVSHRTSQNQADEKKAHTNAAKQCRDEQNDPSFAANHGDKTFAQYYGTNHNGSNAYGKCVSAKAKAQSKAAERAQVTAENNAAKKCRAERRDDPAKFKQTYGTNHNKSNAFGKCVSKKAKAAEHSDNNPIS